LTLELTLHNIGIVANSIEIRNIQKLRLQFCLNPFATLLVFNYFYVEDRSIW